MQQKEINFYSFSPEIKPNTTELSKFSKEKLHPEYGQLPYNAGCDGCFEIIEKRTGDERYFLKDSTNGTEFTIQKSYLPMHYKDAAGRWITIDSRIKKSGEKKFAALQQPFPVEIDLENGFTSLVGEKKIKFNQQVKMYELNGEVLLNEQQSSNEVFFTAGDDGVEQRNFFSGVYRQLKASRGSIETDYILISKPEFNSESKWMVFEDQWNLPDGYSIKYSTQGYLSSAGIWCGDLIVVDENENEKFRIGKTKIFDNNVSNDNNNDETNSGYQFEQTGTIAFIKIFVAVAWLTDSERDYPVTIDPLVSVVTAYSGTALGGSAYTLTLNNYSCPYTITTLFPGGAMITNAGFSGTYSVGPGCGNSCVRADGAFNLLGPCGQSPDPPFLAWYCPGNTQAPCTVVSLAAPALVDCVTPSCSPTSIDISLRLMRDACSGGAQCDNACIRFNEAAYNVTITGITVQAAISSSVAGFNLCSGTTVTYNSNPQYGVPPYTYSWSPGGYTTSAISVTPLVNTTYTLVISDACGATYQALRFVNIIPASTASFTTITPICISQSANFTYTGNGVAATTYLWNFNDPASGANNTSTLQNPSHIFSSPGFYTISLTATLGACVSQPFVQTIFVGPQPTSLFTVTPPQCAGQPVTISYSGNASINATYNWNFGSGTIIGGSGQGPYQVQWNTAGNFPVSLSVSLGSCTSAITNLSIQIFALPTATINVTTPVCAGQNSLITYTGNGGAAAIYNWDFDGGTIISGSNNSPHQINWASPGTYTIQLTVIKNGCSTVAVSQNVLVKPIPTSGFSISTDTTCMNSPVTIVYNGSAGAFAIYNWNFNGGTIISGNGQGPYQISWPSQGLKNITLTVVENGCTSPQTIQTVFTTPALNSNFTVVTPVCANQNSIINYNGNATAGAVYNWDFNGGTVVSGSGGGPYSVNWSAWGNHPVTLTVNQNGCTSIVTTHAVFVNPAPISTFVVGTACAGAITTVEYAGNAGAAGIYNWNFGGGTIVSGTGEGPYEIIWNTAGVQTVSLTVTLNGCISTLTSQQITVIQSPSSSFTVVSPACAGGGTTVTYTGNAAAAAPYNWYFGGGSIISGGGQGPWIITYPNPGSYNITLVVQDFGCISNLNSQTVVVNPIPTAAFSLPSSLCENINATITYQGTAAPSATYNWDFGNGTVTGGSGQGPYQVYWNTPGNHLVTLTVVESGCTSPTIFHTINIMNAPDADFNTTSPICADKNSTITFTGSANAGALFTWDFGTTTVISGSGSGPYELAFPSAGFYSITLTITDFGCTSTSVQNISVNAVPSSSFILSPAGCVNDPVQINYTGNGNNTAIYDWNFDGGIISSGSGQGPYTVSFTDTGNYIISLAVTQMFCTSDTESISIFINPKPIPSFTATPLFACDELHTFFTNNSSGATNYSWNFGDGIVDTTINPNHQYTVGMYDVSLTAVNQYGCSAVYTIADYINVQPTPSVQFASNPSAGLDIALDENEFEFENLTQNGTSYLWTFGDGDSSGIMHPTHVYGDTGNFFVTLIAYNDVGCSDSIKQGPYIIVPGAFIFIPNAFTPNNDGKNDLFRIFGRTIQSTTLQIFNRWGELVYSGDENKEGWDGTYQGQMANTGVYVYHAFITKNSGRTLKLQGDLTLIR